MRKVWDTLIGLVCLALLIGLVWLLLPVIGAILQTVASPGRLPQ